MTDAEPTDMGEVSVSVSMLSTASVVSDEEDEKEEDEESGHVDDEEDVDDINHVSLSKEAVLTNSPTQRPQSEGIQSVSSKKSTYGLSENEKVLSAIVRWGEYASMKVRHGAFGDPLFMEMLQAACGPHDTKGLVPKLTRRSFKGFMIAEFQVTSPSSICYHMLLMHTY
jgi:hypothetical protein